MQVGSTLGKLARQLMEGQLNRIQIEYSGELATYDTSAVKASIIGGLLQGLSEERINLINATVIATRRGIKISEQKEVTCENYASLISLEVITNIGTTTVAGTVCAGRRTSSDK